MNLEYAILELKLLSTAAVLYRAFLCCNLAAAEALRFQVLQLSTKAFQRMVGTFQLLDGVWYFPDKGRVNWAVTITNKLSEAMLCFWLVKTFNYDFCLHG